MPLRTLYSLCRGREALGGGRDRRQAEPSEAVARSQAGGAGARGVAGGRLLSRGRGRKLAAARTVQEEAEARGLSCCHLLLPEEKQMCSLTLAPDP